MDQHLLSTIEKLVESRTGLDAAVLAPSVIERSIQAHLGVRHIGEAEYLELLGRDEDLLAELIDDLAVPETWFFRDHEPFELLRRWVRTEWLKRPGPRRLRVLSMPCASGEEPYSIAMALLDEGLRPEAFAIDGVDISRRALERARRGVYGPGAFRDKRWAIPEQYFVPTGHGQALHTAVRTLVRFIESSALDYGTATPRPCYDVVFCRNLLIYLSAEARRRLAANLDAMLAPGGLVFLGHAEAPHVFLPTYLPVKPTRAFAARKPTGEEATAADVTGDPIESRRTPVRPRRVPHPTTPPRERRAQARTPAPGVLDPESTLQRAGQYADAGDLEEAARLCQEVLTTRPLTVHAHYLLGVIAHARGDDAASEAHLRKALFVEPAHLESLVQLSLLLRGTGRHQEQAALEARIRRVEELQ